LLRALSNPLSTHCRKRKKLSAKKVFQNKIKAAGGHCGPTAWPPLYATIATTTITTTITATTTRAARHHRYSEAGEPVFRPYLRIYDGNLSQKVDSFQLRQFFSKHGKVGDARVMCCTYIKTKRSRGFGFVTIATTVDDESAHAITKLNGQVDLSVHSFESLTIHSECMNDDPAHVLTVQLGFVLQILDGRPLRVKFADQK
jgi:RNA recognition motif-containing protein